MKKGDKVKFSFGGHNLTGIIMEIQGELARVGWTEIKIRCTCWKYLKNLEVVK